MAGAPITLTERAAERIKDLFRRHKMPAEACVRVGPGSCGCSGRSCGLGVEKKPREGDEVFQSKGVTIACDVADAGELNGIEIDYEDSLATGGFVIRNPDRPGCDCDGGCSH